MDEYTYTVYTSGPVTSVKALTLAEAVIEAERHMPMGKGWTFDHETAIDGSVIIRRVNSRGRVLGPSWTVRVTPTVGAPEYRDPNASSN